MTLRLYNEILFNVIHIWYGNISVILLHENNRLKTCWFNGAVMRKAANSYMIYMQRKMRYP